MAFRLFVEKKTEFDVKSRNLSKEIKNYLSIDIRNLKLLNCYDIFIYEDKIKDSIIKSIFSDSEQDKYSYDLNVDLNQKDIIAIEYLSGQFDQRADSAMQLWNLQEDILEQDKNITIKSAEILVFDKLSASELKKIKNYYINPVESREKDLSVLNLSKYNSSKTNSVVSGFIKADGEQIKNILQEYSLAMNVEDLLLIQKYFKEQENREPFEVEIRLLDTYWSDHCRHTTFNTELKSVNFPENQAMKKLYEKYWQNYLDIKNASSKKNKKCSLMDIATLGASYLKAQNKMTNWFVSDEINACTVKMKAKIGNTRKDWLIVFKNETHNHPTEIEPFGGAATCLGGAIRDILSTRAYSYQAVRLSGASASLSPAIENKLSQYQLIHKSALGYSSYGNQIGIATSQVREFYHQGYVAKRMELGAVLGGCLLEDIKFSPPEKGDIVILIGGATGRDGIGGATGSSKKHNDSSQQMSGGEVQKGNPTEERKIQRLFNNREFIKLIKKCNDLGAGGISVAIGELSEGVEVFLDEVPLKYLGLNGLEIAISESQERMAIVVDKDNLSTILSLAEDENLQAVHIANITNDGYLRMYWNNQRIVNLSYEFINTNGASYQTAVSLLEFGNDSYNPIIDAKYKNDTILSTWNDVLSDINVKSQIPLGLLFDSTIGANTILLPYGGKYQMSPEDVSVHKINHKLGASSTAISWGFDPYVSEFSPLLGSMYSILDSVLKLIAVGVKLDDIYLSFQEYFAKTYLEHPSTWSEPVLSLLGALATQIELGIGAIGGKDSMSGSFNDKKVPPTFISFAFAGLDNEQVIANTINLDMSTNKKGYIYCLESYPKDDLTPDFKTIKKNILSYAYVKDNYKIIASKVLNRFGIAEASAKMCFGNRLGITFCDNINRNDLFKPQLGAFLFVVADEISLSELEKLGCYKVGVVNDDGLFIVEKESFSIDTLCREWCKDSVLDYEYSKANYSNDINLELDREKVNKISYKASYNVLKPRVLMPIFVGSNCEYETSYIFEDSGAEVNSFVFKTKNQETIKESLEYFAKEVQRSQIVSLIGGFSYSDEPDGAGKYIANVLSRSVVKESILKFLLSDGLILGICNGFQALIKSGLLGSVDSEYFVKQQDHATLSFNSSGNHIAKIVKTKLYSNSSPWLADMNVGDSYYIPISHGEGRLNATEDVLLKLHANNQIVACYEPDGDNNTFLEPFGNPNGSNGGVESIISADGKVLGCMGHSERIGNDLYKNFSYKVKRNIFKNGVNYFK